MPFDKAVGFFARSASCDTLSTSFGSVPRISRISPPLS